MRIQEVYMIKLLKKALMGLLILFVIIFCLIAFCTVMGIFIMAIPFLLIVGLLYWMYVKLNESS